MITLNAAFTLDDYGVWTQHQSPLTLIQPEETHEETQEKVERLKQAMEKMPQADVPVTHRYLEGIYVREVLMKKGLIVVGKIHKQEHIAIISSGEAMVLTENGLERIKAPYTFKSPPGVRRALYILEDMTWTTVHRTDETDLVAIEEQLIAEDFKALTHAETQLLLSEAIS